MSFNVEKIPNELRERSQWVLWRYEVRDGKHTKVPYTPGGKRARSNNSSTWSSFNDAVSAFKFGGFDGIGFVLSKTDPYTAIDLDNCVENGVISEQARQIVALMNGYTEVTPSGAGLRIIVKGSLPPGGRRSGNIELYDSARYVTITGNALKESVSEIPKRQKELEKLHKEVFAAPYKLAQAFKSGKHGEKLQKLFAGEWGPTGYRSASEAVQALCRFAQRHGLRRTECDTFVRMSGLYTGKWDEVHSSDGRTYAEMTLDNVYQTETDTQNCQNVEDLLSQAVDHASWVLSAPELEFIWDGLLVRGAVHLLAAPPKRGKSTFLTHLLSYLSGPTSGSICVGSEDFPVIKDTFLGRKFAGGQRVLLITENAPQFWAVRRLLPGVMVLSAFKVREAGNSAVPNIIRTGRFDLIIVDSYDKALPIKDENNNSEVAAVVGPIAEASHETGVSVVLVHHHRKGGGSGGDEVRGGSALFGAVDEYLALIRTDDVDEYEEDPETASPMYMSLKPQGRVTRPTTVDFVCTLYDAWIPDEPHDSFDSAENVLIVLRKAEKPLSRAEIEKACDVPKRTIQWALKKLLDEKRVEKVGEGRGIKYRAI